MNRCTLKSPFFRNDRLTFEAHKQNGVLTLGVSSYEYSAGSHTESLYSEHEIVKLHKFLTKVIKNYVKESEEENVG